MKNSIFLSNLHHTYAQTDGTYDIPNSLDGDLLKRAKIEIENNEKQVAELVELLEEHREHIVAGLTAYSLIAATADLEIQRAEASIKVQEIQAHLRKLDEAINKHKQ